VAIASIPEDIRGFGHVKERHLKAAKEKEAALVAAYHSQTVAPRAA
jgi:indolepyruvate ferredoxin oxidoreductase